MRDAPRLWRLFDVWVLRVLQAVLALGIVAAVSIVAWFAVRGVGHAVEHVDTVPELQQAVQSLFGGVLLVVLGLELMETLRHYFIDHRLRVELLISVALVAVARHVIQLDYEHVDAWSLGAMGILVLSLAASYVGVRSFVRADDGRQSER